MTESEIKPFPFLIRSSPIADFSLDYADQIVNDVVILKRTWPPYQLPAAPTWNEDPYQNRSWRLYYHALGTVSHLIDAYDQTGDLTYLVKARLITESWLTEKGTPRPSRSDFVWNEHSVASRTLVMIALFFHWERSLLADTQFQRRLLSAIHTHAIWLTDPTEYRSNNHGILQDRALLSVAVLFPEFTESRQWYKLAKRRLLRRCREDVSPSGVHLEHSPFYHLFFMRLYYTIREFLAAHGRESGEFDRLLERMENYVVHIARNDKSLPLIGDTRHGNVRAELNGKAVGEELRYVLSDGVEGTCPALTDIAFADAGVVVMRDSWQEKNPITLVFVSGFHSTVHKHSDDLSFVLRVGSTDVLIDAGSHNNEKIDPITIYQRSVFGHNAIAVDGMTYPKAKEQIGLSSLDTFASTSSGVQVQGSHRHFPGVEIRRTITYLKPYRFEIHDLIESGDEHEYTQIFNFGTDFTVTDDGDGYLCLDAKSNVRVRLQQQRPIDELRRFHGSSEPVMGWASRTYGKATPFETMHFVVRGRSAEFITSIEVLDRGQTRRK